jgi:two-component system sensor histidine kinase QseC
MHFVRLRWLNSFSRQLMAALAGGVLFGALLLIAGIFAMRFFQGSMFSEIGVSEYAESIAEELQFDAAGHPIAVGPPQMSWLYDSLGKEATYRVLDDTGAVVLSSEPGAPPLTGTGEKPVLEFDNFSFERDGLVMHGATEPTRHAGRNWYVQFAASERLSEMLRNYVAAPLASRSVAILCFGSLVLYCLVMRFTLRAILKPLNDASAIAAKISPQNLGTRLQVQGVPEELRPLVENFNAALDRLEHNYRLQQEFLASAAHELKTPLALIRAQIEVGVDEMSRHELLQDVSRMGRQVQQLLHLAEASEPQNYTFTAVDPNSVAHEVVSYIERLANQQGVSLRVIAAPDSTTLRADRGALFTLLKNLLENAIQHSHAGGVVQLRAESNCISVRDEGPGVLPEDLPKLFTRFWRGPHRRDLGAGLGLSICRQIATVHGWDLQARRGEPGMIFDLRLT